MENHRLVIQFDDICIGFSTKDILTEQSVYIKLNDDYGHISCEQTLLLNSFRNINVLATTYRNCVDIGKLLNAGALLRLLHLNFFNYGVGILDFCYTAYAVLVKSNKECSSMKQSLKANLFYDEGMLKEISKHIACIYKSLDLGIQPINFALSMQSYCEAISKDYYAHDYRLKSDECVAIKVPYSDKETLFKITGTKFFINYYAHDWSAEFNLLPKFSVVVGNRLIDIDYTRDWNMARKIFPDIQSARVCYRTLSAMFQGLVYRALGIKDLKLC